MSDNNKIICQTNDETNSITIHIGLERGHLRFSEGDESDDSTFKIDVRLGSSLPREEDFFERPITKNTNIAGQVCIEFVLGLDVQQQQLRPRITSLRFDPHAPRIDIITIDNGLDVGPLLLEGMFSGSQTQTRDPLFIGGHWKPVITSTRQMFNNSKLRSFDINSIVSTSFPNLSNIDEMFSGCKSLDYVIFSDGSHPNDNLESMVGTFEECTSLTNWTIGLAPPPFRKLKTMERAFKGSGIDNLSVFENATFDSLQSMEETFFGCENLEAVNFSSAKMPKIQNLRRTFYGCPNLVTVLFKGGQRINKNHVRDMTEFLFGKKAEPKPEEGCVIQRAQPSSSDSVTLENASTFFARGSHAKRIPSVRMIERAPPVEATGSKALQDFVRQKPPPPPPLQPRSFRSIRSSSIIQPVNLRIRF